MLAFWKISSHSPRSKAFEKIQSATGNVKEHFLFIYPRCSMTYVFGLWNCLWIITFNGCITSVVDPGWPVSQKVFGRWEVFHKYLWNEWSAALRKTVESLTMRWGWIQPQSLSKKEDKVHHLVLCLAVKSTSVRQLKWGDLKPWSTELPLAFSPCASHCWSQVQCLQCFRYNVHWIYKPPTAFVDETKK